MTDQKKLPTLEEALQEISTLVNKMEHGDLALAQSLTHFERGIHLVKYCQKMLEEAEQKVQLLIQNNQQASLTPYDLECEKNNEDKS